MAAISTPPACAQEVAETYAVPAQPLADSLRAIAVQSGNTVIAPHDLVDGRIAPPLAGRFTAEQAVAVVLRGSGLRARRAGTSIIVERPNPTAGSAATSVEGVEGVEGVEDETIVVTGTRIRGTAPIGADVITINRREIERSGYATTQDIAQTIPQNFGGSPNEGTAAISLNPNSGRNTGSGSSINLRGLGNASTLVLLNGDRPPLGGFAGVFTDISMIPASAIERIEVIADGASAIYGSDAVAGVVNIIPRLGFEGAETSIRVATADGDSEDVVASQIVGARWTGGRAVLAYEYYRRTPLAAANRAFVTDDLRPFGGPDLRSTYASPGTIFAGGRSFAIPAGQDGTDLSRADLLPDTVNRRDGWEGVDVLPRQKRHSAFGALQHDLGDRLQIYAQGLFTTREFSRRSRTSNEAAASVPVTNPFYVDPLGTNRPISVRYDFGRDLGRERRSGKVEAYGATLGLRSDLGRWAVDLRGNIGRQKERSALLNRVNSARLAVALADPNPATAYNLFGDGPSTNPATIDFIRGSTSSSNRGSVWSTTLRADGPLLSLPAGDLRIAIGGEYRSERYRDGATESDTASLEPRILPAIDLPGTRRIRAFYAEALIPLLGGDVVLPGVRRLDLSAAVRTERYSDFGTTTNPKFGVNWEPFRGLRLRGTYGTSFRAPSVDNLRQDPGTALLFAFTIPDPASPTGQSNILVRRGNDPDLRPEEATSWTAGFDIEPPGLAGFRASATYYNIDYRDRITSPAANLFSFLVDRTTYQGIIEDNPSAGAIQAFFDAPGFLNPFGVAPNTIIAVADAQLQNLSVVRQSGVDVDVRYAFDVLGGRGEVGASGAYIFKIDQALTEDAPIRDVVDVLGNPVDLRIRGRANWSDERWGASLFVNYLDSYTNLTNPTPEKVDSWTTVDTQISYRFGQNRGPLADLKVAISATNLFDADPPYAAYNLGLFATGYDPDNASPLGRVVSLQLTKSW